MIGDAITQALPELRTQAESLMVDACVITSAGLPVWNEETGEYEAPAGSTAYTGKCRVQVPNVAEQRADAGERDWTVQAAIISLPIVGSEQVSIGHTVTITAATFDTALQGRVYTVTAEHQKTHATARRLRCEEVTG